LRTCVQWYGNRNAEKVGATRSDSRRTQMVIIRGKNGTKKLTHGKNVPPNGSKTVEKKKRQGTG